MNLLPIFIKVSGRRCVVVGGGEVASRKVETLVRAGARVLVVAPELESVLETARAAGKLEWQEARFAPGHLAGAALVIAATSDHEVNAAVSREAQDLGIPVNVVDRPALCSFVMPSIVDRSPLVIAISSGGAAPVLARLVRSRLEALIPAAYGKLASLAARYRDRVKERLPAGSARRIFWENTFEGAIAERVFAGQEDLAGRDLEIALNRASEARTEGEVYLVGAGPGDPDLLTFRALRLMQKADVVLHDALVSDAIMNLVRKDAERIYVGKKTNNHTLPQQEINALLVKLAREGKRVLRIKGGDPFIFGRGGEEIETLAEQGIAFQVVPGISAANGVASYAGIPLTHRDHAQAVTFVTGHLKNGSSDLDWAALARPNHTLVIYMGLEALRDICSNLVIHGLADSHPIALVQDGTTPRQRVLVSTLGQMPDAAREAGFKSPSLIIVGEVVRLHDKLNWYQGSQQLAH